MPSPPRIGTDEYEFKSGNPTLLRSNEVNLRALKYRRAERTHISQRPSRRFILHAAGDCHSGSPVLSEKVFALLRWRRQQVGPLEGVAYRRIEDSTPADQRCVARASRAPSSRRTSLRHRPADPRAQLRSFQAGGIIARSTGMLPRDTWADALHRSRRTRRPNAYR